MAIDRQILEELQQLIVNGVGGDGHRRPFFLDGNGRLRVAPGPSALFDKDVGTVTSKLVRGNPCSLMRVVVTNVNAAVRFFNIHDKVVGPVATDIPGGQGISLPIPAGTANNPGVLSVELGETHPLVNGLGWSISTVKNVFTDSATASEHSVHLWYFI